MSEASVSKNIGIIAKRLNGTDGVTLEAYKWVDVFKRQGFTCFYFAGELDPHLHNATLVEEAHFTHPDVRAISDLCFGVRTRNRETTRKIQTIKEKLKDELYHFTKVNKIDLLVIENALAIPMNIPLGIALAEFISETGIKTIAHHHDFFWERKRFLVNCIWEYINMSFPPHLPSIKHVVINSSALNQLSLRTGISSTVIPNVMDFKHPPKEIDGYTKDLRKDFGIADDELFVLQPTRIILRKRIEDAIELISRLHKKAALVISHKAGDEGYEYVQRIKEYAELLKVRLVLADEIVAEKRGRLPDGRKVYTLDDLYPYVDLVTYPSSFEGFGNAFLEAIYFKKPVVVNNYSIYSTDIKPKGFKVIEFDGFISADTITHTLKILEDKELCKEWVDHNYEIAFNHYSYEFLERKLSGLLVDFWGEESLPNRK